MHRKDVRSVLTMLGVVVPVGLALVTPTSSLAVQQGTPEATYSCDTVGAATPAANGTAMSGMTMSTPMAGMEMDMGIDLLYIDMMIPHHNGIIAMAEAALPRLTDERLQAIAQDIIEKQSVEIEELYRLRESVGGSGTPMPMDESHMAMMSEMMPGMGSMEEMAMQMDPVAQVQAICAAEDTDLEFIEMTIAHHQMAIMSSEAVLEQSTNDEVRALAERVIEDQQAEIETLEQIREEQ